MADEDTELAISDVAGALRAVRKLFDSGHADEFKTLAVQQVDFGLRRLNDLGRSIGTAVQPK